VVIDTITNSNTNPMSTSMKKGCRSLEPGVGAVVAPRCATVRACEP